MVFFKNKKGQAGIVSLMLGVVLIILGLALSFPVNQVVNGDGVNGVDGLNCSNPEISNQNKAICYQTDTFPPLWTGVIFGLGGLLIWRALI